MGISKSELPIFSKYPQRWAFFKCMLVDTNTITNCGVFYEMWIGNIMQFECIKENSYRVQLHCFRSKSPLVACNEAVTKSAPHFGNVPHIWTLAIVKHYGKVIINLNIQRSRGLRGEVSYGCSLSVRGNLCIYT